MKEVGSCVIGISILSTAAVSDVGRIGMPCRRRYVGVIFHPEETDLTLSRDTGLNFLTTYN